MIKTLLRIPSILFNPLLIPTFGILIIMNSGTYLSYIPEDAKKIIIKIYFISTILIPLSTFPFLYFQKIIKNWELDNNKDRVLPLLILSASHLFGWYLLSRLQVPRMYTYYIFMSGIMTFIIALISMKWKISVHLAGIGGLIGLILALSYKVNTDLHVILVLAVISTGILSYTRLAFNETSPTMTYSGLLLGFSAIYIPTLFI